MADLRHLGKAEGRRRVAELLERFDLVDAAKKPVATYSGGMRRRLDLAMTLIGDPRIIFLDEPTAGLDPAQPARHVGASSASSSRDGVTIFLTTQYLEEADRLAHRIAVLDKGTARRARERRTSSSASCPAATSGSRSPTRRSSSGRPRILDGGHPRRGGADPAGPERRRGRLAASRSSTGSTRRRSTSTALSVQTADLDDVFLSLTGATTNREKVAVR